MHFTEYFYHFRYVELLTFTDSFVRVVGIAITADTNSLVQDEASFTSLTLNIPTGTYEKQVSIILFWLLWSLINNCKIMLLKLHGATLHHSPHWCIFTVYEQYA